MVDQPVISLAEPEPGIAVLTLNDPRRGANILSRAVLAEFATHLDALQARDDLAGLVIRSGKPGMYIAGADLREFAEWLDADTEQVHSVCQRGRDLFRRLAHCPFVTVAAIDGICVGGGAEMAVWCDRRIMTHGPKTEIGFPEVKLGLFPGWGGTARLPRIVGLANAVEMITGGDSIGGQAAFEMGLADDLVTPEQLDEAAIRMIRGQQESRQFGEDRDRWSAAEDQDQTELAFLGATASAYIQGQTKGHYPAPVAALELLLSAAEVDADRACQMETAAFAKLFGSPVNRALLNLFFLRDLNKKDPGIAARDVTPRPIRSVTVIGAGIMGQGIAAANIKRGVPVTMTDANEEALTQGLRQVIEEVSYNKAIKGPDVARAVELSPLLRSGSTDQELAQSDLIIEAVVEDLGAKKGVFRRLEPYAGETTLLASNTSTIPITKLAKELAHPDRCCGIHFFNPVRRMPLVEVIRGQETSDETVATAVAYAKSLGKSPIVIADGPGFLVNRLLLPYMNEALELLLNGAAIKDVERAAKAFGMPMGPITLFDVVGLDTALHAGRVMYDAFPDRVVASELLAIMYKRGRLGQKTGVGFYAYQNKSGRGTPDPEMEAILEERRRGHERLDQEQLTLRMFLPMLVEATRVLEEKRVRSVRDVDLGMVLGVGFPPFKGGLLFWADTLGAAKIVDMLKPFEPLGKRYHPPELLLEMARSGGRFYGESRV
jgi:3-hydroxyacyl-CoA dehydrogenase/enoyl-CoA hydratase/carnithine racemase